MRIVGFIVLSFFLCYSGSKPVFGQSPFPYPFTGLDRANDIQLNTITTAVPFVGISGNALQMGLADIGAVGSNFYSQGAFVGNPALLANGHRYVELTSSYTPWLRSLVPNMGLTSGRVTGTINEHHALAISAKSFNYGKVK